MGYSPGNSQGAGKQQWRAVTFLLWEGPGEEMELQELCRDATNEQRLPGVEANLLLTFVEPRQSCTGHCLTTGHPERKRALICNVC